MLSRILSGLLCQVVIKRVKAYLQRKEIIFLMQEQQPSTKHEILDYLISSKCIKSPCLFLVIVDMIWRHLEGHIDFIYISGWSEIIEKSFIEDNTVCGYDLKSLLSYVGS